MKVLIIDNYDSFTYNLYQFVGEILSSEQNRGAIADFHVLVKRNDEMSLAAIEQLGPDRIIISPGPGSPDNEAYFGVCAQAIRQFGQSVPLLGVCLGMQGIVHVFGGRVVPSPVPMHGKTSAITHSGDGIFRNLPPELEVMRYHSLMTEPQSFPDCLRVTAVVGDYPVEAFDDLDRLRQGGDFEIMGVQHREWPIHGIQFHPESFATEGGKDLIRNFLLG